MMDRCNIFIVLQAIFLIIFLTLASCLDQGFTKRNKQYDIEGLKFSVPESYVWQSPETDNRFLVRVVTPDFEPVGVAHRNLLTHVPEDVDEHHVLLIKVVPNILQLDELKNKTLPLSKTDDLKGRFSKYAYDRKLRSYWQELYVSHDEDWFIECLTKTKIVKYPVCSGYVEYESSVQIVVGFRKSLFDSWAEIQRKSVELVKEFEMPNSVRLYFENNR